MTTTELARRVGILGASGTGKTTLARALAEALRVPAYDSDDYYHEPTDPPYRVQRSPEARCALLERDLGTSDQWVLSGGAAAWVPRPRLDFTHLVFLYVPPRERLERLRLRERRLYGSRIDPGGDMADDHRAFLDWTRGYDDGTAEGTNTLAIHEALLASATCPVLRLHGTETVAENLARLLAALGH